MHVFTFFLKVGFNWISPKDCTMGLHWAGSPGESGEGIRVGSCHGALQGIIWEAMSTSNLLNGGGRGIHHGSGFD